MSRRKDEMTREQFWAKWKPMDASSPRWRAQLMGDLAAVVRMALRHREQERLAMARKTAGLPVEEGDE